MGLFKPNLEKMKAKKDIKGLIKAMKDKDNMVRRNAVSALGEIGDASNIDPLIQALRDEDTDVCYRAAQSLGNLGDKRAVEPLIKALSDSRAGVRSGAGEALGKIKDPRAEIGDPKAVGPLVWEMKVAEGMYAKGGPEKALVSIGEAAVNGLAEVLNRKDDPVWRHRAIKALAAIGEPALEPLTQALDDEDKYVREVAQKTLKKMKNLK